jgi:hypothetical protein
LLLVAVEEAFKNLKGDLAIRPIPLAPGLTLGRVFLDEVGARQIPAFARAGLAQLIAIEAIA